MRLLLVQVTTGTDPAANRQTIRDAVSAGLAAAGPVDLVVLPEAAQVDFGDGESLLESAEALDGPFVGLLGELAAKAGATVVGGMFESLQGGLPYNTLVAVEPDGGLAAAYRKAHLYDAFGYRESDRLTAGEPSATTTYVVDSQGARWCVGLTTCYDLRFPEQFRAVVDAGADLVLVPAAWVMGPSKEHHWTTLLAARAVENTVYVAGVGKATARYCGLSRLVDPMGRVVAGMAEQDGAVAAEADISRVREVRRVNPSLANRRWDVTPRT